MCQTDQLPLKLLRDANTACEHEVDVEGDVSGDNAEDEEISESEEDDDEVTREDNDISNIEAELPLTSDVKFRRMNCMGHTLQLIIKKVYNISITLTY